MARNRRPAAAWLAAWLAASISAPAFAQTRAAVPAAGSAAPAAPVVPVSGSAMGLPSTAIAPLSAPSITGLAPAPTFAAAPAASVAAAPAAVVAARAAAPAPARAVPALSGAAAAAATGPEATPGSAPAASAPLPASRSDVSSRPSSRPENTREAAGRLPDGLYGSGTSSPYGSVAAATIAGGVEAWGGTREDGTPDPGAPRARPRAARAALIAGGTIVAGSAAAFTFPAAIPVVLAAAKGPALWAGLGLMSLSRLWKTPGAGVEAPRGPPGRIAAKAAAVHLWLAARAAPRPAGSWLGNRFRGAVFGLPLSSVNWISDRWTAARAGADAQAGLEARAGNSSFAAFGHWLLGGLRAAAVWVPVALATMMLGLQASKPFVRFANPLNDAGMLSLDDLEKFSLGGHMLGYVAATLAAQAVTLGVFDGVRALAAKAGAGRASGLLAGAAALAVSAALIMTVTTVPSVVGTLLGIEAAALWLRSRSGSWLAPLALRGFFALASLEFARLGIGLATPAAGVLIGLPAVWTGVAASGLLLGALAWSAKSLRPSALWTAFQVQLARVRDFGASWAKPNADGSPKSPWPLLKLAALWGWILYALGDVTFSGAHALAGGAEPTPAILAQMLSSPVDLVLANFLLVGFLEEYIFRRGIFKPLLDRVARWKLSSPKAFWLAAVASGLIFSYAHYVDFGALLAHLGIGAQGPSPVATGMYAFSLGGFLSRAVLGVVLAWLYAASGTLLLPAVAHFLADSYEGLGLRWGFVPFLAMAAVSLLLQLARKRGATHRS